MTEFINPLNTNILSVSLASPCNMYISFAVNAVQISILVSKPEKNDEVRIIGLSH